MNRRSALSAAWRALHDGIARFRRPRGVPTNERAAREGVGDSSSLLTAKSDEVSTGPDTTEMVLSHFTERSVLHAGNAADLVPFAVGDRMRLATCSGVAWFRENHLAVVNLYGGHLRIYRFHPGGGIGAAPARLELLHELTEGIEFPEDVAVSPDGQLLAVTHSLSAKFGVSLFPIEATCLAPGPAREKIRPGVPGSAFHGVSFSPDSRHLAFTEISMPGYVEVVRVASTTRERTCFLENRLVPLKPKSVAFSQDARLAVIAMGLNASRKEGLAPSGGMLSVHRFDAANGVIADEPLAQLRGVGSSLANMEICKFLPAMSARRYRILVADQGADVIPSFEFDAQARTLVSTGIFKAGLSFPHGLDVSADGRLVAMTSYGDDTVRIVGVTPFTAHAGQQ
jgi:hypothetical protein